MHTEITETFAKLLAKGVLAIRADAYFQFRRQTGETYESAIETAAEYLHVSRSVAVRRVNDAKTIYDFLEANGYSRDDLGIGENAITRAIALTEDVIDKRDLGDDAGPS